MPALQDPRHEAFAQACAKGALLIDAYGFVRHRGHPRRLALKDEVAEQIAELRDAQTEAKDVSLPGLLASFASAAATSRALPGLPLAGAARAFGPRRGPTLDESRAPVSGLADAARVASQREPRP